MLGNPGKREGRDGFVYSKQVRSRPRTGRLAKLGAFATLLLASTILAVLLTLHLPANTPAEEGSIVPPIDAASTLAEKGSKTPPGGAKLTADKPKRKTFIVLPSVNAANTSAKKSSKAPPSDGKLPADKPKRKTSTARHSHPLVSAALPGDIPAQKSSVAASKHRNTSAKKTLPMPPRYIIGGAMKCGTNEAMRLISLHPRAKFKTCTIKHDKKKCTTKNYQGKRIGNVTNFWESNPYLLVESSVEQYLKRIAKTDGNTTVTFDKSPTYLSTFELPPLPAAVRRLMPGTKMVFSLCDPAERLVSEFYHYRRDQDAEAYFNDTFQSRGLPIPEDFAEFVDLMDLNSTACFGRSKACSEIRSQFLPKGVYSKGIADWLKFYPPSDLLILDMEASPTENARRLIEFAGLPLEEYPWGCEDGPKKFRNLEVKSYKGRDSMWSKFAKSMDKLAQFYVEPNKDLAEMLHVEFPLQWKSTSSQNAFSLAPVSVRQGLSDRDEGAPMGTTKSASGFGKPFLLIHIGPAMTGATSLQCLFGSHMDVLEEDDIFYLGNYNVPSTCGRDRTHDSKEFPEKSVRRTLFDQCLHCIMDDSECNCEKAFNEFETLLEAHRIQNQSVMISEEMFSQPYCADGTVKRLARIMSKWNVRVAYTYRRHYERLMDEYYQTNDPAGTGGHNFTLWPDDGGSAIQSLPSWTSSHGTQLMSGQLNRLRVWAKYFPDIQIIKMNDGDNAIGNFVCQMIPEARKLCDQMLSKQRAYNMVNPPSSASLSFDMLAVAARRRGWVDQKISRVTVRDGLESFSIGLGLSSLQGLPAECLSQDEATVLMNDTVTYENTMVQEFGMPHTRTAGSGSPLKAAFKEALGKNTFCSVNVDAMFDSDSKWKAFLVEM